MKYKSKCRIVIGVFVVVMLFVAIHMIVLCSNIRINWDVFCDGGMERGDEVVSLGLSEHLVIQFGEYKDVISIISIGNTDAVYVCSSYVSNNLMASVTGQVYESYRKVSKYELYDIGSNCQISSKWGNYGWSYASKTSSWIYLPTNITHGKVALKKCPTEEEEGTDRGRSLK